MIEKTIRKSYKIYLYLRKKFAGKRGRRIDKEIYDDH